MTLLRAAVNKIIEVILPGRCGGCGSGGTYLCGTCLASMERPLIQTITSGAHASADANAAFSYDDPVARATVQHLKFRNLRAIAPAMAAPIAAMVHQTSVRETPFDAIVAVPLHRSRLRQRGYNQALLLATNIAAALELPLATAWLTRERQDGCRVKARGVAARQANVQDAFAATDDDDGRRIALIDDVMTTGATLDAAASASVHAGAAAVHCYALVRED